ncbi:MAG: GW dipeptide domain-containing protein, partial [Nitrospinota bacterium]
NFHSSELNRNFREVIFVGEIRKEGTAGGSQSQQQAKPQSGGNVVKEVLQTSIYTYLRVTQGNDTVWLAAPKLEVNVGDQVRFPAGVTMSNFHSKELNRDFPKVIFVGQVQKVETAGGSQSQQQSNSQSGGNVVKEVLQTSIYTYLRVTQGNDTVWLAAPKLEVNVGDQVRFPAGVTMSNFHSKELNRDFPKVIFVGQVQKAG